MAYSRAMKRNSPKNYGRQSADKTIKSLSLDKDVVSWVKKEAKKNGVSESSFVNELLKKLLQVMLLTSLVRYLCGSTPMQAITATIGDAFRIGSFITKAVAQLIA